MRKKIKNKKKSMSITLDSELLKIVDNIYSNKSKFLENCIIEELCKNENIKNELIKSNIIL